MPLPFDIGAIGQQATQIAVQGLQKAWPAIDGRKRDLATAIDDAIARASAKAWSQTSSKLAGMPSSLSDGAADLRALVVAMGITRSVLLDPARKPTGNDQKFADVLAQTWIIVARRGGYRDQSIEDVKANAKGAAELPVILIIAIILEAAAIAAVAGFLIYKASEVIETALADQVEDDELVRLHAETQKVIDNHIAAEKLAGHPLPYTSDELAVLDALWKAQQHIVDAVAPPKPLPPPGYEGLNIGIVVLALGLVGAGYLYLRPGRG